MNLGVLKLENQLVCIADIYAPKMQLERHLNLEITMDHSLVLCRQFLMDLLATFLIHETIQVSHYYSVKSMTKNFTGIDVTNSIGSRIQVNLNESGKEFYDIIDEYTRICNEFTEKQESTQKVK